MYDTTALSYVSADFDHDRTVLIAGYETTATTLSWTLLEIARHPEMQTRLRDEIYEMEQKIQSRGDTEFTATDFENMPYLTAILKVGLSSNTGVTSSHL